MISTKQVLTLLVKKRGRKLALPKSLNKKIKKIKPYNAKLILHYVQQRIQKSFDNVNKNATTKNVRCKA